MKKTIFLLLLIWAVDKVTAQQTTAGKGLPVNFTLKVPEMTDPDSLGIYWFVLPYQDGTEQQVLFSQKKQEKGRYQQTVLFPDSLQGRTIGYLYAANQDRYDFMRNFVLNGPMDRTETWGYADEAGIIKPTSMLFNEPGSAGEKADFAKPYIGITTNGKAIKNLFPMKKTGYTTLPVKNAVMAFLESLTEEEKAKSIFPIESNEWRRWHNIERWERSGVCLEQMTPAQKDLVFAFLKESLSARGLQKAKDIMTMEDYLASLVPESKFLGGEKYWFTFFGTPSDEEPWGWQIEGHHLVINYFVLGDQVVMTPTFMGSEPTYIADGKNKGLRTFQAEEEKGLQFYLSLDSMQKKEATLFTTKDYDFNRSEAFRDNEIIPTTGITAKKLSAPQQAALLDLIAEYVNNIREGQAKVKMEDVKLHLNDTHFTWIQNNSPESPFYYRIHSPVILIEFDHQTPVFLYDKKQTTARKPVKSHIHTVVRTPNGNDYGKDLLREHLERDHKGEKHHHHQKPAAKNKKTPVKKSTSTKKAK